MQAIWNQVKTTIKDRVPNHSYKMWIEPLQLNNYHHDSLILSCPNTFSQRKIETQYASMIEHEVNKLCENSLKLIFSVSDVKDLSKPGDSQKSDILKPDVYKQLSLPDFDYHVQTGRLLQKNYTFDHFVVGKSNNFAYSAALSIASRKDTDQNSLFLASKTGMGKTHLSQAMGNHILNAFPNQKIYYITAEDFTNEMISGIRNNTITSFKEKYRKNCDMLLLEDVHFLTGKERTQFELGQILDYMADAGKKIIFTSCYLPSQIPKLKEQLRSRLSSGLVSNIDPPDFDTRIKILRKKAVEKGYTIPAEVLTYLAEQLSENVRQLESGLIGVAAKSTLLGVPIDIELAENVVKNIVNKDVTITIDSIKKLVSREYGIKVSDLESKSRKQIYVRPRQIAIYLSRKYTTLPIQTIGKSFNRYHATALHSINIIEKEIKANPSLKKQIMLLSKKLDTK